jgi:DNA-binding NarL/FixJ family response regulator
MDRTGGSRAGGGLASADPLAGGEWRLTVVLLSLHPLFARGLTAVLGEAGFDVAEEAQVDRWSRESGDRLVVTLDDEAPLRRVEQLQVRLPGLLSVALLQDASPSGYARALARCTGAVPLDAELEDLVDVVRAAARGRAVLPAGVARQLAAGAMLDDAAPVLSGQQVGWLRELGNGATVASLAKSAGYSEREMYRLLSALYARLGGTTRTEALLRADRWGLLRQRPSPAPVLDLVEYERTTGTGPRR